jgi:hypothetical protein
LPIVGVLLSAISKTKILQLRKTFLPTGRLIVGRDAPAQANSQPTLYFPGGQSGRSNLGLCLRLSGLAHNRLDILRTDTEMSR